MTDKIKVSIGSSKDFDKLSTEEHAEITMMCLSKLCYKAEELKELYIQLAKTYGVEMGICDISMIVQVSSPIFKHTHCSYTLGTKEGIEHAILTLKDSFAEQVADLEKEESNDKEQG